MEFRFTDHEEQFRQEIRSFLDDELAEDWEEEFDLNSQAGVDAMDDFKLAFSRKLSEKGWVAMAWPAAFGGRGATVMQQVIYNEEMAYRNAPVTTNMGVAWVGPAVMAAGTKEQRDYFLPRIPTLEDIWCTLYSEVAAGSDLASVQTRAVREGDDYVINGHKIWTTGAHRANWGWLAARTDPTVPKHKGISMFLVPMDTPGITVRPLVNLADEHTFNEVFFEDVRVPASHRVGSENGGWQLLTLSLDFERSHIATSARARRNWEDILLVLRDKKPSPGPGRDQVRTRLGEMHVEIEIARLLSYKVASIQQSGMVPNREATMAKLFSTEMRQRLAAAGLRMLGMYGPLRPTSRYAILRGSLERTYLRSVADTIAGGTSEIMRNVLAMRGLGLPRAE